MLGTQYLPASLAMQIFLAGSALWVTFFWVKPFLLAAGMIEVYTKFYFFSILPFLICFFYLTPKFGAEGMAIGYLGHATILLIIPGIRQLL
jgi:O-antigen/teichoic acid export membrane protein